MHRLGCIFECRMALSFENFENVQIRVCDVYISFSIQHVQFLSSNHTTFRVLSLSLDFSTLIEIAVWWM